MVLVFFFKFLVCGTFLGWEHSFQHINTKKQRKMTLEKKTKRTRVMPVSVLALCQESGIKEDIQEFYITVERLYPGCLFTIPKDEKKEEWLGRLTQLLEADPQVHRTIVIKRENLFVDFKSEHLGVPFFFVDVTFSSEMSEQEEDEQYQRIMSAPDVMDMISREDGETMEDFVKRCFTY